MWCAGHKESPAGITSLSQSAQHEIHSIAIWHSASRPICRYARHHQTGYAICTCGRSTMRMASDYQCLQVTLTGERPVIFTIDAEDHTLDGHTSARWPCATAVDGSSLPCRKAIARRPRAPGVALVALTSDIGTLLQAYDASRSYHSLARAFGFHGATYRAGPSRCRRSRVAFTTAQAKTMTAAQPEVTASP